MITPRQVKDLLDAVVSIDRRDLERRHTQAIKRNSGPRNARDGYPTGGSGSGADAGDPVGAAVSATLEVDVNPATGRTRTRNGRAVIHDRRVSDPLAEHLEQANGYLEQAVSSLGAYVSRLNAIDRLTDDSDLNPEPGCWCMARIGEFEEVHRTGTVGGRLPEAKPLGRWAYRFVETAERLPTIEECRLHNEGRRVHVRAS